ncbi:MAG: hypothetical protein R3B47_07205 [Bacteroidia bacterium]
MKVVEKAVIFLLLIISISCAQNKLSVGVALAYERSFTPQPEQIIGTSTRNYGGGGEMLAYLQYQPGPRFFFRTGLGIGQSKQKSRANGIVVPDAIDPRNGILYFLDIENNTATGWLVLPLDFGFRFPAKNGKWSFHAGAGASWQIIVTGSGGSSIKSYGGMNPRDNAFDPAFFPEFTDLPFSRFSFRVFSGVEKKMGNRMLVAFEPYLRFSPDKEILDFTRPREVDMFDLGFALRLRRQ